MENVIWSPDIFLNTFGITLMMKSRGVNEKMSLVNVQRNQQQWLQMKCQRLAKDLQIYVIQVYTQHSGFDRIKFAN